MARPAGAAGRGRRPRGDGARAAAQGARRRWAAWSTTSQPGDIVLVKPNVAFDRSPNLGATTNPEMIEALVRMLLVDCRAQEVRVADNPIESPADCFAKSGIGGAAERAGGRVYLPDSNAFQHAAHPRGRR